MPESTTSSPRRAAAAAFIIAGALLVGGLVAGIALLPVGTWPYVLAWCAIAVGFVVLAVPPGSPVARAALVIGAVGWALYALAGAGLGVPVELAVVAAPLAVAGGIAAAVVLITSGSLARRVGMVFLVTMIAAGVFVLGALGVLTGYASVAMLVFAAGLVVTGILLIRSGGRSVSQASSRGDVAS